MDSNDVNNIDGLEEENSISEGEENEEDKDELVEDDEVLEEKSDFAYEFWGCFGFVVNGISINSLDDIYSINMQNLTFDHLERLDFLDLETTYHFYCWYTRVNDFSVCKSNIIRPTQGGIIQQIFVYF